MKFDAVNKGTIGANAIVTVTGDSSVVATGACMVVCDDTFEGKRYMEFTCVSGFPLSGGMGFLHESEDITTKASAFFNVFTSYPNICPNIDVQRSTCRLGTGSGAYSSFGGGALRFMIAIDTATGEIWGGYNGVWVTNDPTGAGVRTGLTPGKYTPLFATFGAESVDFFLEKADCNHDIPDGFLAVNEVSVVAVAPRTLKFDPVNNSNIPNVAEINEDGNSIVLKGSNVSVGCDNYFEGKVYMEFKSDTLGSRDIMNGLAHNSVDIAGFGSAFINFTNSQYSKGIVHYYAGNRWSAGLTVLSTNIAAGEIAMIAIDTATGEYWIGKNGVWVGNDPTGAAFRSDLLTGGYTPYCGAIVGGSIESTNEFTFNEADLTYPLPDGFEAVNRVGSGDVVGDVYLIAGSVVDDQGFAAVRRILVLIQETREVHADILSEVDGTFSIEATQDVLYIVICEDQNVDPLNALVFDHITPTLLVVPEEP